MGSSPEQPAGIQGFQEISWDLLVMGEAAPTPQHGTGRAEEVLCSRSQTAFTSSWSWQRKNILPSNGPSLSASHFIILICKNSKMLSAGPYFRG